MNILLWTWLGKFVGYRERDDLWTYFGVHIGRFYGDEVYSPDGLYLGELQETSRLITDTRKKGLRYEPYTSLPKTAAYVRHVDNTSFGMQPEYEDFPCSTS